MYRATISVEYCGYKYDVPISYSGDKSEDELNSLALKKIHKLVATTELFKTELLLQTIIDLNDRLEAIETILYNNNLLE